jgi:thiol-disulfide isomerase/thioredoxin
MTTATRRIPSIIAALLALVVAIAACSVDTGAPPATDTAATQEPTTSPPPPSTSSPAVDPSSAPPATTDPPAPVVVLDQAWATAELVDVSTGDAFRIADHAGKVIVIETMAIWCTNCRAQQGDVMTALERLPADSVVYVVLDTDPSENAASLARYKDRNGFVGLYAIADRPVARALAQEFGDLVLNPPSTPIIIVGTDGRVTLTGYGHKSVDDLVSLAQAHGA